MRMALGLKDKSSRGLGQPAPKRAYRLLGSKGALEIARPLCPGQGWLPSHAPRVHQRGPWRERVRSAPRSPGRDRRLHTGPGGMVSSVAGCALGPFLAGAFRSVSVAGLFAFGSFTEPGWWSPSPFTSAGLHQLFQALDGCGKSVPLDLQVLDDPVEVHVKPPSGAGPRIRAATANPGGSGSSAGSTDRRSSGATCRSS